MLLANKFFDLVIGVDFHATTLPPFNPVHPFIGLTLDIASFIPFIGSTTFINGVPCGNSSTTGMLTTKVHIPLGGPFALAATMGNESVNFFGSSNTFVEGSRLSGAGYMVMSCSDVGVPPIIQTGKKGKKKKSLLAPTSVTLPIPKGSPVMVGGPYVPDIMGAIEGLAMGMGMGAIMKKFGKVAKKALTKFNHGVLKKSKFTKSLSKKFCKMGFEPVNLVTGAVVYEGVDFELPGIIPFAWERSWYSDSKYEGMLGHGWHCSYDMHIKYADDNEALIVALPDGRPVVFPILEIGKEEYNRSEKLTLRYIKDDTYEIYDHASRLTYLFFKYSREDVFHLKNISDNYNHSIVVKFIGDRLIYIIDSVGRKIEFACDDSKRITKVYINELGKVQTLVSYSYDINGDMIGITDALDQTTHIKHKNHLMVEKIDRNGESFYWKYDKKERCVHTWGDGGIMEGWIEYCKGYNLVTNSLNATTRYDFTPDGLVTSVTDPLGNTDQTRYNESGEVSDKIDAQGVIVGYDYDDNGYLTAIHYPDGGVQRILYDEYEQIILITTPNNSSTVYAYGDDGLLSNKLTSNGNNIRYEYNEHSLLSTVKLDGELKIELTYDTQYNVIRADYSDGLHSKWDYDSMGRVVNSFESSGRQTGYSYDVLGRVVKCIAPDSNVINLTYDAYDDVVKAEDHHSTVEFEYTSLGSMTKRRENGKTVEFKYNKDEQLTSLRNEAGNVYHFGRDMAGRIVKEVGFDGITKKYNRNMVGLVESIDLSGDRSNGYTYDRCGRLSSVNYHDGTRDYYEYSRDGDIIKAVNYNSEILIARDRSGRILSETQEGHSVTSGYDKQGMRTSIKSSLGANISVGYTNNGMMNKISTDGWDMSLKYDSRGLEIEREMSGMVKSSYEYDFSGRVSRHKVNTGRGETRSTQYNWSVNDRLFSMVDEMTKDITYFDYDSQGFLISANYNKIEKLFRIPDSVGNLYKNKNLDDRKYGESGQLLESEKVKYNYDADGNLIERIHPDGECWKYIWLANGMLKRVIRPDRNSVEFEYDALGRRTAKVFDGEVNRFVWDGNTPLHEWKYPVEERPQKVTDEFGFVKKVGEEPTENITTWVFEEGTFVPTAKIIGDQQYSIITDYLGTPVEMYDKIGIKVWAASLDIYGNVRKFEGELPQSGCPFRYQGQYEDSETGLYYNRFRYYSPQMGGYISQDPIGLAGGNPTLYGYVTDTGTWLDVFGLLTKDKLAEVQKMGAEAEKIAQKKYKFDKNTQTIPSIDKGRYHIPDGMTESDIFEVKCVKKQCYTKQIKSYVAIDRKVTLITDIDTKLSKPLQKMVDDGEIKLERTDLKNRPKVKPKCK